MKKDKEELMIADELRRCAEILIGISEKLKIDEVSDVAKEKDDLKEEEEKEKMWSVAPCLLLM